MKWPSALSGPLGNSQKLETRHKLYRQIKEAGQTDNPSILAVYRQEMRTILLSSVKKWEHYCLLLCEVRYLLTTDLHTNFQTVVDF
jgi:hypothetical protein